MGQYSRFLQLQGTERNFESLFVNLTRLISLFFTQSKNPKILKKFYTNKEFLINLSKAKTFSSRKQGKNDSILNSPHFNPSIKAELVQQLKRNSTFSNNNNLTPNFNLESFDSSMGFRKGNKKNTKLLPNEEEPEEERTRSGIKKTTFGKIKALLPEITEEENFKETDHEFMISIVYKQKSSKIGKDPGTFNSKLKNTTFKDEEI